MTEHEDKDYASPTDNHGLYKHGQGDPNWAYEADMETIEERLVVRDTDANRTDYTPHEDAIFIATDNGNVYDGDGSAWNEADWTNSGEHVVRSDIPVDNTMDIPDGYTFVMVESVEGSGTIQGNGALRVIDKDDGDVLWEEGGS